MGSARAEFKLNLLPFVHEHSRTGDRGTVLMGEEVAVLRKFCTKPILDEWQIADIACVVQHSSARVGDGIS